MGYYAQFPTPIPHLEVRSIVLLTRPPLGLAAPYDLHALATPPAFNLSQDQTLQLFFVDPLGLAAFGANLPKKLACFEPALSSGPVRRLGCPSRRPPGG